MGRNQLRCALIWRQYASLRSVLIPRPNQYLNAVAEWMERISFLRENRLSIFFLIPPSHWIQRFPLNRQRSSPSRWIHTPNDRDMRAFLDRTRAKRRKNTFFCLNYTIINHERWIFIQMSRAQYHDIVSLAFFCCCWLSFSNRREEKENMWADIARPFLCHWLEAKQFQM